MNCWPTKALKKRISTMAKQITSRLSRTAPLAAPGGSSISMSGVLPDAVSAAMSAPEMVDQGR
ncbi:MAG TPA: hypothetical protein DHV93_05255 [Holophagaceae bacterium]|nr:hypothetical protein [Holophagaceae bacterium]